MSARSVRLSAAAVTLLVFALAAWWWQDTHLAAHTVVLGGDAGGLARATPQDEHLAATALESAANDPAAAGLEAFIVMRHEHVVFERYGRGFDGQREIDSGSWARVLLALSAGIAAEDNLLPMQALRGFDAAPLRDAIVNGAHQSYADYLSFKIWRRLNAASAWIAAAPDGAVPADCCFHARLLDWMRVAGLLVDDGRFEGSQVVPSGWAARLPRPVSAAGNEGFGVELPGGAHGEPLAASDAFFLRGPARWRLWLIPSEHLAVLFGAENPTAAATAWDETRLANLVLDALSEQPTSKSPASQLEQLVPGH